MEFGYHFYPNLFIFFSFNSGYLIYSEFKCPNLWDFSSEKKTKIAKNVIENLWMCEISAKWRMHVFWLMNKWLWTIFRGLFCCSNQFCSWHLNINMVRPKRDVSPKKEEEMRNLLLESKDKCIFSTNFWGSTRVHHNHRQLITKKLKIFKKYWAFELFKKSNL